MFEKSKSTTERAVNFVRAHPAPEEGVVGAFKLVMPEAQRKACSGKRMGKGVDNPLPGRKNVHLSAGKEGGGQRELATAGASLPGKPPPEVLGARVCFATIISEKS